MSTHAKLDIMAPLWTLNHFLETSSSCKRHTCSINNNHHSAWFSLISKRRTFVDLSNWEPVGCGKSPTRKEQLIGRSSWSSCLNYSIVMLSCHYDRDTLDTCLMLPFLSTTDLPEGSEADPNESNRYPFLKHRHRRNVTSHHSFSLFWQF